MRGKRAMAMWTTQLETAMAFLTRRRPRYDFSAFTDDELAELAERQAAAKV
jgi:hypothetical protein